MFECYKEQTDRRQYGKTLEALNSYSKKHLKYSADLAALFGETMSEPIINMPEEPEEGTGKSKSSSTPRRSTNTSRGCAK